jgi:vesicle-associated membrane protein 7
MSEKDFGNRIPFLFLDDIKSRFHQSYGDKAENALPFSLNGDFGRVLRRQMEFFSDSEKSDKITKVKGQIQEVRDIMIDNIEKVLDRGEKIDLLVDRTQDLSDSAANFRQKTKKLKDTMWWRNVKIIAILIFILLVIAFVVVWLICGVPAFDRCRSWVVTPTSPTSAPTPVTTMRPVTTTITPTKQ